MVNKGTQNSFFYRNNYQIVDQTELKPHPPTNVLLALFVVKRLFLHQSLPGTQGLLATLVEEYN